MSLYESKFILDPLWKVNRSSYPFVFGGFVIKIVYRVYEEMTKSRFYGLFYKNVDEEINSSSDDHEHLSNLDISETDSLLPVWFNTVKSGNKTTYYLRFYVPLQYTTNQPYGFSICYYNPNIKSDTELGKLEPIILSNRNISNGYDLPYNQGRFNQGWNSISFTLHDAESKNIFVPIVDFSMFEFSPNILEVTTSANELFEKLVKNSSIRSNKKDDTASREDVIKHIIPYKRVNLENNLQLINGIIDFMPDPKLEISELIFKH